MKIHIPTIGEKLTLIADWHINLKPAYGQDMRLLELAGHTGPYWPVPPPVPFLILAGTVLTVKRIYIRQNKKDYDSLTFGIDVSPDRRLVSKSKGGLAPYQMRFFASLADVNTMEIEHAHV